MSEFECKKCGFVDKLGEALHCPVCEPSLNEKDPACYFLNQLNTKCRVDGTLCSFADKRLFDECPKISA